MVQQKAGLLAVGKVPISGDLHQLSRERKRERDNGNKIWHLKLKRYKKQKE